MCEHVNTVKASINLLQLKDSNADQSAALRVIKN
jgi:hypothetical protein